MDLRDLLAASLSGIIRKEIPEIMDHALNTYFKTHKISPEQPIQQDVVNIEQVEKITNYTRPTIYGKVSRGEIPVLSRGRPLLFSESLINQWIKAGRPKTADVEEIEHLLEIKIKKIER